MTEPPHFRDRELAAGLTRALAEMPVVVVTGMRQVGKSTLIERLSAASGRRVVTLDDFPQLEAARRNPEQLLRGDEPLTIDEAQRAPELLLAIKRLVDRRRAPGRFLLSGSTNFALLRGVAESLAGRALYLTLHPFTRREVHGRTSREPYVVRLLRDGRPPSGWPRAGGPVEDDDILRGGLPPVCLGLVPTPALWLRGYEQTYLERDLRALSQVADLVAFRGLLRLAMLRTGQVLKVSELARDARLSAATAGRYLALLETSFVVRRLEPFLNNRASRLLKSPKLYAGDAGLAAHVSGVHELADEPLRGALLETYVAQNLAALLEAWAPEARLGYWHVQGRHEVDFVIERGRRCVAVEVKAGSRFGDHDLAGLRALLAATPRCQAGVLAYGGADAVPLGDRLSAVPLGTLLS